MLVAPGATEGVVIDPAQPLPALVVQIVKDGIPPTLTTGDEFDAMNTFLVALNGSITHAGAALFVVVPAPTLSGSTVTAFDVTLVSLNVPGARAFNQAIHFTGFPSASAVRS